MTIKTKMTAVISALALSVAGGAAAIAQEAEIPAPPAEEAPLAPLDLETPAPGAEFSDSQISAFAAAYVQVMQIGMSADQQIQAAASDEERMAVQMDAQQQMAAAVEGVEGLSVDDYNTILTAAQSDEALANRIQAEVDANVAQ